jgi:hypothetical protein
MAKLYEVFIIRPELFFSVAFASVCFKFRTIEFISSKFSSLQKIIILFSKNLAIL